jgi:hypothetical protein
MGTSTDLPFLLARRMKEGQRRMKGGQRRMKVSHRREILMVIKEREMHLKYEKVSQTDCFRND